MSETTEDITYCCNFRKCVEHNKHIFNNKMLINRCHKCKIVDILTETQYIEMHERMKNIMKHITSIWKINDIDFKNKRK